MTLPATVNRGLNDSLDSFDTLVNRLFNGVDAEGGSPSRYAVDVREDENHFYIDAKLPGFTRDQIDITLEDQQLVISAQRGETRGDSNGQSQPNHQWIHRERRDSRFVRTFRLPPTVDGQNIDAKLENGVLTLSLKKREEAKPRKIRVG